LQRLRRWARRERFFRERAVFLFLFWPFFKFNAKSLKNDRRSLLSEKSSSDVKRAVSSVAFLVLRDVSSKSGTTIASSATRRSSFINR